MTLLEPILQSRRDLPHPALDIDAPRVEAEGGCGVIGVASSMPIAGRHIIGPVAQMCNRGNGKGGGIAVVGCFPEFQRHYAIHVGYLKPDVRQALEEKYLSPFFDLAQVEEQSRLEDYREIPRLEIEPPRVVRYFARVQPRVLDEFAARHGFTDRQAAEDEFVYQNSYRLNKEYYADLEDKAAFVLSHGRNLMILKGVGYCEDIARYYRIEDLKGHVWIGHQRYPTRGRVWHPGGAHPFMGLDEALVHNGDFANYYGVCQYLKPRGYEPLFLTDTEVSVLAFDLYHRVYGYPLEYIFEALAPTTEHDFAMLPPDRQATYRALQRAHVHGSPDGPWFFIIARNEVRADQMQLIGITDTSMLRPQVFALQETEDGTGRKISIGAIGSEKQAIDAFFASLASEDTRLAPVADQYWNARGGSYSDGGAFVFSVQGAPGSETLTCTDKFGQTVSAPGGQRPFSENGRSPDGQLGAIFEQASGPGADPAAAFASLVGSGTLGRADFKTLQAACGRVVSLAAADEGARARAVAWLTLLNDRRYDCGAKKRSSVLAIVRAALDEVFDQVQPVAAAQGRHARVNWETRETLIPPPGPDAVLFLDAQAFPPDGEHAASRLLVRAHEMGWKRFVLYRCKGDRFIGCGLGPRSDGVRIDVYGCSGDYLGSGLDGAEIHVHNDAQDQVGQILKRGKIVIYGMVGQTFLYGAKGGEAYVMGNAAGRPLINAVGRVRAIINGTSLDYCAESFMAGAETDGGFVIINGMQFDACGQLARLAQPYPGGNFFSLASGGAGYVNDPQQKLTADQLNESDFVPFTEEDWAVIEPHLRENQALFGIPIAALLQGRAPDQVYRKVVAAKVGAVSKGERGN